MTPKTIAVCSAVALMITLSGFRYAFRADTILQPTTRSAGDASMPPEHILLMGGRIDINTATAETLEALDAIGPALAARIVTFRDRNGPFATVDDIMRVPGIGPKKLSRNRAYIEVDVP